MRVLDARYLSPLTRDACLQDNPASKICVELKTADAALAGGIARFAAGDPNGGGFSFYMGRMIDGTWAYWFGTQQQTYVLEEPPGELLACSATASIEIRREPRADAAAVRSVADLGELKAERFVLTKAGSHQAAGERGEGWYFVTSPAEGWVPAQDVTDATLSDCLLHDAIEESTRG